MKTLKSYVCGRWHESAEDLVPLFDPCTEEVIARAGTAGVDFAAVLEHARSVGGASLRAMGFAARGELLKAISKVLRDHRDELLDLSRLNSGTTRPDGSFDIDGAGGTLAYYAVQAKMLGDRTFLVEGDGVQLARGEGFWGQHVLVPRQGVAVLINAFNFPTWGFAEKVACAFFAGMPVVIKPATATAMITERAVELLVEAGILPAGSLQLLCGGTGDLLDRLGPQDVLAFTGSADTAAVLRSRPRLTEVNVHVNVEADSLNAAVLAPGVAAGGACWELFLKDVAREMTQKTGQKCTAVRRVLVPAERLDEVAEALAARLAGVVAGNPLDPATTMGPLATPRQLPDVVAATARLRQAARLIAGTGERVDGAGSPAGKGYFFAPTLLAVEDARAAAVIHQVEVFGPVATLVPYDGTAEDAAAIVALGGGTLVTSAYGDDGDWLAPFFAGAGCTTGRLYLGSEASAGDAPGSGIALPQTLHGGPGRAGGGEELGGLTGVRLYLQRLAIQGSRASVERLAGVAG